MQDLIKDLIREGFEPYLTSVGGSGLGILSPYAEHRNRESGISRPRADVGQATPPDTPMPIAQKHLEIVDSDKNAGRNLDSLRASFETITISELATWGDELGRWLYV